MERGLALVGGAVFTGRRRTALTPASIMVRGERIEALVPGESLDVGPECAVTDCRGKFLLPGLVDSHVHLAFSAGPDHASTIEVLEGDSEETLLLRQARNAQECLAAGITTVRDCGSRGLSVLALRRAIAEHLIAGPRLLACGMPVTTPRGHLHFCGLRAEGVEAVRAATRAMLDSGADFIKLMASGGRMTPGSDPASPQYDVQELQAICEEAHAEGRKVAAHVLSAEAAKRCLAAGVDHLEHCEWQRPEGGSGYNLRHAEEMAERDVVVGLTIPGLVRGALSGQDAARGQEAQERAYAAYSPYRDMRRRGVEVMLSSDAGVRLTPFRDFHHSLQAFAYLLNCSPAEALLAATSIPARALGLDSDVGTLEAGKRADILVIDGDPLKDLANVARVSMVVQSGRVTAAAGWLALPDGRRLSSETGGTTSPSRQRGD